MSVPKQPWEGAKPINPSASYCGLLEAGWGSRSTALNDLHGIIPLVKSHRSPNIGLKTIECRRPDLGIRRMYQGEGPDLKSRKGPC